MFLKWGNVIINQVKMVTALLHILHVMNSRYQINSKKQDAFKCQREMTNKNYEIHLKWRECDIRVESIKQGGFWTGGSYEHTQKKNWGKAEGRLKT